MKKKLLVISFQPYDARMYPHLYDAIAGLKQVFDIDYIANDDRGYGLYDLFGHLWPFNKRREVKKILNGIYRASCIIKNRYIALTSIRHILVSGAYDGVIAIDHQALNMACFYAPLGKKIFFWSHDIICADSRYYRSPLIRRMLQNNKIAIRRCGLIIVQDEFRGALLDSVINSYEIEKVYFPVSLKDNSFAMQVAEQKRCSIMHQLPIKIMQITACSRRGSNLLLQEVQSAPQVVKLYFQGIVFENMFDAIHSAYYRPTIFPINDSFEKMRTNIATIDIGFVSYIRKELNERFISYATGQAVEFLRLGIPLLSFGNDIWGRFVESHNVGIHLTNIHELVESLLHLKKHYNDYSMSARKLYSSTFDIDRHLPTLTEKLQMSFSDTRCSSFLHGPVTFRW